MKELRPPSLSPNAPAKRTWPIYLAIVCVVFGVRLLQWQNDFLTLDNTMPRLIARYKEEAQFLLAGDLASLVGSTSQPDEMLLMHPPGYPIVIAGIYKLSGNSDRALRFFQIACEAVTIILIFLIATRLIPRGAALIAALLAAAAPQLAFRSLVLMPDSLSALPLVGAILLFTKAVEDGSVRKMFFAGGLIGVSCLNQGGMVIDLTNMTAKRLDYERKVVWTETGNRWRDLYLFLQATNTGLIPIGGGCPTVGIPGFMLGGGISFVSRSYGLSVDNLESIDLLTPDGRLRRISENANKLGGTV